MICLTCANFGVPELFGRTGNISGTASILKKLLVPSKVKLDAEKMGKVRSCRIPSDNSAAHLPRRGTIRQATFSRRGILYPHKKRLKSRTSSDEEHKICTFIIKGLEIMLMCYRGVVDEMLKSRDHVI